MSQVTVYLDPDIDQRLRAAAAAAGVSVSRWLADLIRQRTESQWPADFAALAGSCPDFPDVYEIRGMSGTDVPRDTF